MGAGNEKMEKSQRLTEKEIVFCRLAAQGVLASQAASQAGYKKGSYCTQLIRKTKIQNRIAALQKEMADSDSVAENDEILHFLTSIMRGDEYEEKKDSMIKDRMRAAELLGKRLRLFDECKDNDPQVIIIDDIETGKR